MGPAHYETEPHPLTLRAETKSACAFRSFTLKTLKVGPSIISTTLLAWIDLTVNVQSKVARLSDCYGLQKQAFLLMLDFWEFVC